MEVISLTPKNGQKVVEYATVAIKAGQVVVCPTDTVYGLLADATNKKAVAQLYEVKQRDPSHYLPIFVKNMAMARKLARISPKSEKLLDVKWPGKFTFVFKRIPAKLFGVDAETIALRIPHYAFVNSLLEVLNIPLTGTSANISGRPSLVKIDEVIAQFQNEKNSPDLIINAGDLPESKSSAIIDLTGITPKIIRQ